MVAAGGDQYDYDTNCNSANQAGHCRVFAYDADSADWVQRGTDIRGGASGDKMGLGIAINADGTVLACGAPYSDVQANNGGEVQVYEYNAASDVWELIGAPIYGTVSKQWLGFNVALNAAGDILAVGSPGTNTINNDGAVAVYQRVDDAWVLLGSAIEGNAYGNAKNNRCGKSVDLDETGHILAVSCSHGSPGTVEIFHYNSDDNAWGLQATIDEVESSSRFGASRRSKSRGRPPQPD